MSHTFPASTLNLIELFQGPLRDVRFPDVDGDRLGAAIEAVRAAQEAVEHAQASVEAAREILAEKERFVTQETDRALAYVRVYAADRPELLAAIEALTPRQNARRGPGRPRKSSMPAVDTEAAAE